MLQKSLLIVILIICDSVCWAQERSLLDKARQLESTGKYEDAVYLYRQAIYEDPYNPEVYALYGHLLRRIGEFSILSKDMRNFALALQGVPQECSILALAEIYFQLDEIDYAINLLKNSSEVMPHRADIANHLGRLYELTGKYSLAKKEYERAEALGEINNSRDALSRLAFMRFTRQVAFAGGLCGIFISIILFALFFSRLKERRDSIISARMRERVYENQMDELSPFSSYIHSDREMPLTSVLTDREGNVVRYEFLPNAEKPPEISTGVFLAFLFSIVSVIPVYGIPLGFVSMFATLFLINRYLPHKERTSAVKLLLVTLFLSFFGFIISVFASYTFFSEKSIPPASGFYTAIERTPSFVIVLFLIAALLLSMVVHEAGHALTALWCGDLTAKRSGRLTLNPLKHISLFGTIILPILLIIISSGRVAFGYAKPVPINARNFGKRRRDEVLTAAAGSITNIAVALVSIAILTALGNTISVLGAPLRISGYKDFLMPVVIEGPGGSVLSILVQFLKASIIVNLFLGTVNLIPIPPLDGFYLVENLFPSNYKPFFLMLRSMGFVILFFLIFAGAFSLILIPLSYLADVFSSFLFNLTHIF